jgi:hypothetical protein
MGSMIHRDTQRIAGDAERITHGLECLARDRLVWARKREEKDLMDLIEGLKGLEIDVSLMLTDCISAGCQVGEEAPKVVFHDFRELFSCLDALFNGLKRARLELDRAYIHPAVLEHLEVDLVRFRKLIGEVQRHLNEGEHQTAVAPEGFQAHLS